MPGFRNSTELLSLFLSVFGPVFAQVSGEWVNESEGKLKFKKEVIMIRKVGDYFSR